MLIFDPSVNGPGAAPSIIDVQLTDAAAGVFTWSTYQLLNSPVPAQYTNGVLRSPAQYSAGLVLTDQTESVLNPAQDPRAMLLNSESRSSAGLGVSYTPAQLFGAYTNAAVQTQLGDVCVALTPSLSGSAPGNMLGVSANMVYALPSQPNVWVAIVGGAPVAQTAAVGMGAIFISTNYGVAWQIKCMLPVPPVRGSHPYPTVVVDAQGNIYLVQLLLDTIQVLLGNVGTSGWTVIHSIPYSSWNGGRPRVVLLPVVGGGAVLIINLYDSGSSIPLFWGAYQYNGGNSPVEYGSTYFSQLPAGGVFAPFLPAVSGTQVGKWVLTSTEGTDNIFVCYPSGPINETTAFNTQVSIFDSLNSISPSVPGLLGLLPIVDSPAIAQPLLSASQLFSTLPSNSGIVEITNA